MSGLFTEAHFCGILNIIEINELREGIFIASPLWNQQRIRVNSGGVLFYE
jgi:hypothetical protein